MTQNILKVENFPYSQGELERQYHTEPDGMVQQPSTPGIAPTPGTPSMLHSSKTHGKGSAKGSSPMDQNPQTAWWNQSQASSSWESQNNWSGDPYNQEELHQIPDIVK